MGPKRRPHKRSSATLEVGNPTQSASAASAGDDSKLRFETPPTFDPEKTTYDVWKTALADWRHVTGTSLEDQGSVIRMHLLGEAKRAAQHVELDDIRSRQGVQKLLEELDRVFIPDAMVREFQLQHKLFRLVRSSDKTVCQFINDFSDQYLKLRQAGHSLPDRTLSYLLLSACDLTVDKIQLVMSSLNGTVTFQGMKHQLKLIFSADVLAQKPQQNDLFSSSGSETFLNKNDNDETAETTTLLANRQYRPQREYYRGRSTFPRRNFRTRARYSPHGRNPTSRHGLFMRCLRCESVYHLIRDCPENKPGGSSGYRRTNDGGQRRNSDRNDRNRERDNYSRDHEVNYSYLFVGCASSEQDRLQQLIKDTLGYAVLDSGCTNSVTGRDWF